MRYVKKNIAYTKMITTEPVLRVLKQLILHQVLNKLQELPEVLECMTLHPGLEPVCLNPWSLQNALRYYEADHGRLRTKERAEYVSPSNIYLGCI